MTPVIGIPKKNIKIPTVKIGEYKTPRIIRIKNKKSIISKNFKVASWMTKKRKNLAIHSTDCESLLSECQSLLTKR